MISPLNSPANYWLLSAIYLALHFGAYALTLRKLPPFKLEKFIFLYHFISALLFSCVVLLGLVNHMTEQHIAAAVSVVCAHGIYSLTFLELWTLSQISFSRELLIHIETYGSLEICPPPAHLVLLGESKKVERLHAMLRLQLIALEDNQFHLTSRGRLVSSVLAAIAWLANLNKTG